MKIKRAINNLLILVSPGSSTTVCSGEEILKTGVPRLAKIGFLNIFFCNMLPNETNFFFWIFTK